MAWLPYSTNVHQLDHLFVHASDAEALTFLMLPLPALPLPAEIKHFRICFQFQKVNTSRSASSSAFPFEKWFCNL
jgi:hypothetical protein